MQKVSERQSYMRIHVHLLMRNAFFGFSRIDVHHSDWCEGYINACRKRYDKRRQSNKRPSLARGVYTLSFETTSPVLTYFHQGRY
jgi:hypothetical protein